ncbi:MAG: hypothetical protein Q7K40_05390 [bacterium]|nr:hypothetical protein [bacterium]
MFRFFLLLALSCTALLFFGIKANPKLVGGFTMTIAFIINVGAIGYCLWTIPKVYFSPKEQKRSIWEETDLWIAYDENRRLQEKASTTSQFFTKD